MDRNKLIAIVGVSENPDKTGFKIFTDLLRAGFKVAAVGIRGGAIAGKRVYKSLKDLPAKPDMILTVVPPAGTDKTVDDAIDLGIKEIWMQPGSQSETAVQRAKAVGMKVTESGCFMLAHGIW
ncbi:CoA-binding protein [Endomicrobiia bacterium]|nr:CoA-binding protein [Endomicrobiia bacterium]GHT13146.1 CoA-binding protein [Endomicrobiia bacterium]GHT20355.1 CoA-binding protein [Endomicrobiia bacterium]GHT27355.1 CoA-binding protein [Endomicrobiia bacterium]GHT30172.1 CoA-binding protein [Endomicrobiia bacterium]